MREYVYVTIGKEFLRLRWLRESWAAAVVRCRKDSLQENARQHRSPGIQGAAAGNVAAMIVGFNWGGWVTGGSSDKHAATAARDATVVALAPICVERFRAQGDAATKLVELTKASTWERGGLIEKSGFAMMPGSKTADTDVARACAQILATPKT